MTAVWTTTTRGLVTQARQLGRGLAAARGRLIAAAYRLSAEKLRSMGHEAAAADLDHLAGLTERAGGRVTRDIAERGSVPTHGVALTHEVVVRDGDVDRPALFLGFSAVGAEIAAVVGFEDDPERPLCVDVTAIVGLAGPP